MKITQGSELDEGEIAGEAARAAEHAGYGLGDYDPPVLRRSGRTWTAFFAGRWPVRAGRHFLVVVDGLTGSTRVVAGR